MKIFKIVKDKEFKNPRFYISNGSTKVYGFRTIKMAKLFIQKYFPNTNIEILNQSENERN